MTAPTRAFIAITADRTILNECVEKFPVSKEVMVEQWIDDIREFLLTGEHFARVISTVDMNK